MRISIQKSTGKLLEMQSNATEGTLIANAVAAAYAQSDVEERVVTDAEYQALVSAQPKSKFEVNSLILTKLAENDTKIIRAITEGDSVRIAAHKQAQDILRKGLIK